MNSKKMNGYAFFIGTMSGHLIEWYDYGIYGFLAVYMAKEFFSNQPPIIGLISSFLLFSISFIFRPLGGVFFGPLADKIGRKKILVIVIGLMSLSTFLPGILPGSNHIGMIAPIVLVLTRCIQGFSAGGEIGTITSYVAENSPKNRL